MPPARKATKKAKRGQRRVIRKPKQQADHEDTSKGRHGTAQERSSVEYTFDLSERICDRVANGESPTSVCRDPAMPTWSVLSRWRRTKPDFARRFNLAREEGCEFYAFDIVDIADDSTNDYVTRLNGTRAFDRENFERSRLRVDSRKWTVSKILRHVYGDKTDVSLRTPEGIDVRVEERNSLIDAIVKLVHPKPDGQTKPGQKEESRER